MDEKVKIILNTYLSDIKSLYQEISKWIDNKPLKMKEEEIVVHEKAPGKYKVQKLIIFDDNDNKIAELVPVGAWIIGAKGRIDLVGKLDKVTIVDLEKGGPTLATSITEGGKKEENKTKYLYKVVDHEGWYWIEDTRLGRIYALDQKLFFELLAEVSDYEV